jgi:hypothetical protein
MRERTLVVLRPAGGDVYALAVDRSMIMKSWWKLALRR